MLSVSRNSRIRDRLFTRCTCENFVRMMSMMVVLYLIVSFLFCKVGVIAEHGEEECKMGLCTSQLVKQTVKAVGTTSSRSDECVYI